MHENAYNHQNKWSKMHFHINIDAEELDYFPINKTQYQLNNIADIIALIMWIFQYHLNVA